MSAKHWLHGLISAFIGGGAAAVSASVSASLIAPETFNFHGGIWHLLEIILGTFGVNGILTACAYLKQSPLPDESGNGATNGKVVLFDKAA